MIDTHLALADCRFCHPIVPDALSRQGEVGGALEFRGIVRVPNGHQASSKSFAPLVRRVPVTGSVVQVTGKVNRFLAQPGILSHLSRPMDES